jgi:transcription initiation factor TFIIIB Brf1 subunit/transcription initiation factor TFIIB
MLSKNYILSVDPITKSNTNCSKNKPVNNFISKLTKPKLTKPKLTKPKLTKPKLTKPKLTKPKLTKPKLVIKLPTLPPSPIIDYVHEPDSIKLNLIDNVNDTKDIWASFFDEFNASESLILTDNYAKHQKKVAPVIMTSMSVHTNINDLTMTKYITNGNVINMSLDEDDTFDIINRDNVCNICSNSLLVSGNILICQTCGIEQQNSSNMTEEEYSTSALTDCNVNTNGFIAMKMIGKGSYGYQRSMLKTCANYKKYRRINTLKDMKNWNIQSTKHHIPKNVIIEANEMFAKIKEKGYVFRKDGKKGVLSACLYYACYNNNISKTPGEIAQFSVIEEKFHSLGDRILHDLNERGVIEIPVKINPITDYVDRYMTLLSIDNIYRQFVLDLIDRAEAKHIHILHDSKWNTKSVGCIYMLVDRVPRLKKKISKEIIEKECGISKTTFIRYYNTLCDYYKKFKKVFKKHGISMKATWRSKPIVKDDSNYLTH